MDENLLFLIKAIIISIVEGITEFLPISSTGHMIIVGHFIKFEGEFSKRFMIVIQLGAILSIMVLYRKKIIGSLKNLKPGQFGFKLWSSLAIAFIPSGIVGFLFNDIIEETLMKPIPVALSLVVGGLWMIYAERKFRKTNSISRMEDITYRQAFIIGIFQCIALIWPGFSRSASTIIGGWIVGLSTIASAEFSFFLALPTMIIASVYSLLETDLILNSFEILTLISGFIISFFVALVVVGRFINYLKNKPMKVFANYRIIVGLLIILMALINIL